MLFEEIVTNALMEGLDVSAIKEKYYPNIPEGDFGRIVAADPTSGNGARLGSYSKWLLSLYQHLPENERRRLVDEDLTKATEYLTVFDKYKNQLPQEARNINSYDGLPSLYDAVKKFMDNKPHTKGEMTRQIKAGAEKVYEDEKWLVVIPHTEEAACLYGANTKWCTAARGDNLFKEYDKLGNLYINIDKQNNRKYQFQFETYSFKDEMDEEIPPVILRNISATKGLADFYKKIRNSIDFLRIGSAYDNIGGLRQGMVRVKSNGKWGFVDESGKEIIPCIYDEAEDFNDGLVNVKSNGKWGYIDNTGNVVIPFIYNASRWFFEGLASVKLNGKWGYIDKAGNVVIPFKYTRADKFFKGFARVVIDDKYGYIDKEGNWYDMDPRKLQENIINITRKELRNMVLECARQFLVSEEHMPVPKKTNVPFSISPEKVLKVKRFLDDGFQRGNYEDIGPDGMPCSYKVVAMLSSDKQTPLKNMYMEDMYDLLCAKFKTMFNDEQERALFMRRVADDWYDGKINSLGMLSVNHL